MKKVERGLGVTPASVSDYRELARKRLPRQFFDYVDGAAYQEVTADRNLEALADLELRQRILRDVSNVDTSCRLLDRDLAMPLILAPIGLAGCFARRGEVQALQAANSAGIPFCLSTVGICSIEELQRVATAPFWFQLYVIRDRSCAQDLMRRAQAAGCDTLVFTVDLPILGERYRDIRNGLSGGAGFVGSLKRGLDILSHPRWLWDVALRGTPLVFGNLIEAVPNASSLSDFKAWVDS